MTKEQKTAHEKLERLSNALADQIDSLTDEEILAEAIEAGEDVDAIAARTKELIESVVKEVGRRRLSNARASYDAQKAIRRSNVLAWPLEKKRALIKKFSKRAGAPEIKFTRAARKEEDSESDLNSYLEDLIELEIIDDEEGEE